MLDLPLPILLAVLLGTAAFAGIAYFVASTLMGDDRTEQRQKRMTGKRAAAAEADPLAGRKRAVAVTLKEMENRQSAKEKISIQLRMERAGLNTDEKTFYVFSAIAAVIAPVLLYGVGPTLPLPVYLVVSLVGMVGLPRFFLNFLTKRRQGKFLNEFANAIDVIVRGMKSGLPITDCLKIIAQESPEPVRGLFREVIEQQRVGVPLQECFERMVRTMPLPEAKFFAIVIAIQAQSGGNLSEALSNLAGVLRDRKQIAAKVQALSAEAKASAYVLGSLPFAVMTMVYLSTPKYILLLFSTSAGNFMLGCSAVWMTFGVLAMRKMINFKF